MYLQPSYTVNRTGRKRKGAVMPGGMTAPMFSRTGSAGMEEARRPTTKDQPRRAALSNRCGGAGLYMTKDRYAPEAVRRTTMLFLS